MTCISTGGIPPKLIATDPKTKDRRVLLDLNPQFAELTFGHVEIFRCKNHDGLAVAADLYYPTNYVSGKLYPLVIQTHGESRNRFWIDGPFTTANAAQALANKGFFVLQTSSGADPYDKTALDKDVKKDSTSQEAPSSFHSSSPPLMNWIVVA
jgi:dipeptidyl aminopeptidase/acylaminoacyl peptidase